MYRNFEAASFCVIAHAWHEGNHSGHLDRTYSVFEDASAASLTELAVQHSGSVVAYMLLQRALRYPERVLRNLCSQAEPRPKEFLAPNVEKCPIS